MPAPSSPRRIRRVEGTILSFDDRDGGPTCSSVDIVDGRIHGVDLPRGAGSGASDEVFVAGDGVVLPGLIDAHLHLILGGLSLTALDLSGVTSRAAFEAAIAARHAELPAQAWLEAIGWSEANWPGREAPDHTWLAAAGNRPAIAWRMDHHACLVNRPVLEALDLRGDPPGGRIVRAADGSPSGLLQEAAAWDLARPRVPSPTVEQKRVAVLAAQRLLNRVGLTTVGSMENAEDLRTVIDPLRRELSVRIQATLMDRNWLDGAPPQAHPKAHPEAHPEAHPQARTAGLALAACVSGDEWLAIIGFKAFLDGTLGSRTARMLDGYSDDCSNHGTFVELAESGRLGEWIRAVSECGLSPSMHAIGDAALRLALDAADLVPEAHVRIEHAQTAHPRDVVRSRGRWLSMQPLHKADDGRYAHHRLGPERMDRFFVFRDFLSAGAHMAFGSDWPIVSPDPLRGVRAAVTGLTLAGEPVATRQNLRPVEALLAYTRDAAACLRCEDRGVIRPGALADFTILSHDPMTADWINDPPTVVATIVGGVVVHQHAPR